VALIVQKYGGSSVANAEKILNVARRIGRTKDQGNLVVSTISAMGDTTDELIDLAGKITKRPNLREMDMLLSTGELVSCALVTMALQELSHKAISLSGAQAGIRTDTTYGKAKIAVVEPQRILTELAAGKIVIVAGFQGITPDHEVTTLGRGASDTTAVAIAAGLKADRCEVYTDVEGIYTADPRLVPKARKLDEVGFEEMLEMASYGAKMNPRSIELGMVYNVPIIVASSFVDKPGTLIHHGANKDMKVGEIRNRVRGIPTDKNVAKITVQEVQDRPGIAANIFEPLASADISVDVIVQNAGVQGKTDVTFTVKKTDLDRALDVIKPLAEKLGAGGVVSTTNLAKVSIVGTGMQDTPGYASKMFRSLADANINIFMISTSEIRITCVIEEARLGDAARILHTVFELDRSE